MWAAEQWGVNGTGAVLDVCSKAGFRELVLERRSKGEVLRQYLIEGGEAFFEEVAGAKERGEGEYGDEDHTQDK